KVAAGRLKAAAEIHVIEGKQLFIQQQNGDKGVWQPVEQVQALPAGFKQAGVAKLGFYFPASLLMAAPGVPYTILYGLFGNEFVSVIRSLPQQGVPGFPAGIGPA